MKEEEVNENQRKMINQNIIVCFPLMLRVYIYPSQNGREGSAIQENRKLTIATYTPTWLIN